MAGTKYWLYLMFPKKSMRFLPKMAAKMIRNIKGKANVNRAAGGLRQKAFCSYFSWWATKAGGLIVIPAPPGPRRRAGDRHPRATGGRPVARPGRGLGRGPSRSVGAAPAGR